MTTTIHVGDALTIPSLLDAASVDAVVTDPPYGLGFMGRAWDHEVPGVPFWQAIMHAMKPGAHLLAFAGTRTQHRMAVAIEDAGFEIRDTLMWLYGSGFPKSLDVSKAIDKAAGAERSRYERGAFGGSFSDDNGTTYGTAIDNTPITPEAGRWQGWGTALKPSFEPIILARKPLAGTVAANVLAHGTGALNIDGTRIPTDDNLNGGAYAENPTERDNWVTNTRKGDKNSWRRGGAGDYEQPSGRWPANVVLDEDVAEGHEWSRFFYVAKASRAERNRGLDGMPTRAGGIKNASGRGFSERDPYAVIEVANHHPTVKPVALMRWLVRLVTPPGGIVLDPFMGSGSTGIAAVQEGFRFIGIELDEEYAEIARRRIEGDAPMFNQVEMVP